MRFRLWRAGLLLAAANGLGSGVTAQQVVPAAPPQPTANLAIATATPQDALLTALATRLRGVLAQEHLKGKQRFEDDTLVMEANTRKARLHLSGKTGREEAFLREMTVPDANGWRMELQTLPGDYIGQAVRPQTLAVTYHDQAGKAVGWNEYLGQYKVVAADKTLIVNLYYGKEVKPGLLARLKAAVQSEAEKAAAL